MVAYTNGGGGGGGGGGHFVIHSYLTSLLLTCQYVNRKMIQNRKVIRLSFNVSFEQAMYNRPFSKMVAENSNKLKLKTYTAAQERAL